MSLRYQLTPRAQQDVDRITDFIAEDNRVARAEDRAHPSLAEGRGDLVDAETGAGDEGQG